MQRKITLNVAYIILAVFGVVLLRDFWIESRTVADIPYSEFQKLLKDRQIEEIEISTEEVNGTLREPVDGRTRFVARRVEPQFAELLDLHDTKYVQKQESTMLVGLASWLMPALFFVFIWMFFIRRMTERGAAGGLMQGHRI